MRQMGLLQAALESERKRVRQVPTAGSELPVSVSPVPGFSLASLLTCGDCDRPLQPSYETGGKRSYVFLCGCRRASVDAGVVERLARDRVEAESLDLVTGVPPERLRLVFEGLFVQVRVGELPDELEFVWRV